jgi:hypothetical protein
MGKLSRQKGLSFERWVAIKLRRIFPEARRQLEYHARDARGIDLQETGRFRFQCKRGRKYSPVTAIAEIQCNRLFEIPVLVTQGDHAEPLAVLPFDEFLALLESAEVWSS